MVDIAGILSSIKGKVLDAKHSELLKHAYDLQNQNIEQLKTNNEALREKAQLLEEKAVRLSRENEVLKTTVSQLQAQVRMVPSVPTLDSLSEYAVSILRVYQQANQTGLFMDEIEPHIRCSNIQAEAGMDELKAAGIIFAGGGIVGRGITYRLTQEGKRLLMKPLPS
jgi:FtsZ-binding cell division protein ZapB